MNINADMPINEQAINAEQHGYYAHAMKLWEKVITQSKDRSLMQQYAIIRRDFCQSAVKNGWKRPEHRLEDIAK